MTSEKHTTSDSSIEEIIDYHERHNDNTSTGGSGGAIGRCYECAFCKRGFTNAQALGGHMNIHRKDKAKAKKTNHELSLLVNTKSHGDFKPQKNSSLASSNRFLHNSRFLTCKNYQPYYSIPNHNNRQTCKQFDLFTHEKDHHLSMHGYRFMDHNFELGIGLPLGEEGKERKSDGMNGDLDLELHLGQRP